MGWPSVIFSYALEGERRTSLLVSNAVPAKASNLATHFGISCPIGWDQGAAFTLALVASNPCSPTSDVRSRLFP